MAAIIACILMAVILASGLGYYISDRLPRRVKVVEDEWSFSPYSCALKHNYEVQVKGEEAPMFRPPDTLPEGYMISINHKDKKLWLIKVED